MVSLVRNCLYFTSNSVALPFTLPPTGLNLINSSIIHFSCLLPLFNSKTELWLIDERLSDYHFLVKMIEDFHFRMCPTARCTKSPPIGVGFGPCAQLFPPNFRYPGRKSATFKNMFSDCPSMTIKIYEGVCHFTKNNRLLGQFEFTVDGDSDGEEMGRAGSARIELNFELDASGVMEVSAKLGQTATGISINYFDERTCHSW